MVKEGAISADLRLCFLLVMKWDSHLSQPGCSGGYQASRISWDDMTAMQQLWSRPAPTPEQFGGRMQQAWASAVIDMEQTERCFKRAFKRRSAPGWSLVLTARSRMELTVERGCTTYSADIAPGLWSA
eukprot:2255542-Pyramimonas_sp.AAC.1